MNRRDELEAWCAEQLGETRPLEALPAQASTRRFYRVRCASVSRIVMDAPPETENNRQFRLLSRVFRSQGVPVPEVLAYDERGFFIVTDFGDTRFELAYAQGRADVALEAALANLVRMQSIRHEAIPPYEVSRFHDELAIFSEWLVARLLGLGLPPFAAPALEALIDATQTQPQATLHRDYHCRNLMLQGDGSLGVVDFQDALVGPVTYDLVSLLRDCYAFFPAAHVAWWLRRYLAMTDWGMEAPGFVRAFDFTGMQRHLKAAGIFARLHLRDGRGSHLKDIAPTLQRVVAVGRVWPPLRQLADWVQAQVLPATLRAVAEAQAGGR